MGEALDPVHLKKAGTPVPANDIWIAAVAVRHGATVLTYDAHFRTIVRVGATVLTDAGGEHLQRAPSRAPSDHDRAS